MGRFVRLKENNGGFTLVELALATIILTVIMVPLMRAFMMAGSTITKSASFGATTTAMENTMELVAAASFQNMDDVVNIETALDKLTAYNSSGVTVSEFTDVAGGGSTGTNSFAIGENSQGYTVTNVDVGGQNGAGIVDVVITPIDGSASEGDLAYNEAYSDVNTEFFSSFTNMDLTMLQPGMGINSTSGKVEIDETNHVDFLAQKSLMADARITDPTGLTNLTRTIEVHIEESAETTTVGELLQYRVIYKYSASGNGAGPYYYTNTVFEGNAFLGSDDIFSVQLVYFPLYHGTETIEIYNKLDYSARFFLIKQDIIGFPRPFYTSSTDVNASIAQDTAYNLAIKLTEDEGNNDLKLYTNVNQSITGTGSTMTGTFSYAYYYTSGSNTSMSLADKLVANEQGGRGYNVLVRVYEPNGTGSFALASEITSVKLS